MSPVRDAMLNQSRGAHVFCSSLSWRQYRQPSLPTISRCSASNSLFLLLSSAIDCCSCVSTAAGSVHFPGMPSSALSDSARAHSAPARSDVFVPARYTTVAAMSATATTTTAGRRVSHVLSFRGPSPSSAKPQFLLASRGAAAAAPHPGAACAAAAGPIPTAPALVLLALAVGEVGGKAVPMEWSGSSATAPWDLGGVGGGAPVRVRVQP